MLFLPREIHAFLLNDAIKENISYYDELRNAAYEYAAKKGFKHKHRFKKVGIASGTLCVICGKQIDQMEEDLKKGLEYRK